MKLLAFSDIHGSVEHFDSLKQEIAEADLVLLTGDITHFGNRSDAEQVISRVASINRRVLAIPGNCDDRSVWTYLEEAGIGLHAKHATAGGFCFVGLGGGLISPFKTPQEYTEEQFEVFLAEAMQGVNPACPLILVSHQPPHGSLADKAMGIRHVGSRTVQRFILERKPLLCFTGHIHESKSVSTFGSTCLINPGAFRDGMYCAVKIGTDIETIELRNTDKKRKS